MSLFISGCTDDDNEMTTQQILDQALQSKDWTLVSHLSQRILIENLDQKSREDALKNFVDANKMLEDNLKLINMLETVESDTNSNEMKLFILQELFIAYKAISKYTEAIENGKKLHRKLAEIYGESSSEASKFKLELAQLTINAKEFTLAEELLLEPLKMQIESEIYNKSIFMLIELYFLSEQYDKAKNTIQTFLENKDLPPDVIAQTLFILADIYEIEDDKKNALKLFKEIISTHPNPDVVKFRVKKLEK